MEAAAPPRMPIMVPNLYDIGADRAERMEVNLHRAICRLSLDLLPANNLLTQRCDFYTFLPSSKCKMQESVAKVRPKAAETRAV